MTFSPGTYRVELWGAGTSAGGGYTSGQIHFFNVTKLYLYIGGVAQRGELSGIGGYNGGGTSTIIGKYAPDDAIRQLGGDGATDIRFLKDSLDSRIMVAGGSGGGNSIMKGGHGGGFIGGDGSATVSDYTSTIIGRGGSQKKRRRRAK